MLFSCPVCSYSKLKEPPRSSGGGGSLEICPACGFQFGVDDDDRGFSYESWRAAWLKRGAPWSSVGIKAPKGWNGQTLPLAAAPDSSGKKPPTRKPSAAKAAPKKGRCSAS